MPSTRRLKLLSAFRPLSALVGSHIEVADRIEEYADPGISEFALRDRGLWSHPHRQAADRRPDEGTERVVPFAVA